MRQQLTPENSEINAKYDLDLPMKSRLMNKVQFANENCSNMEVAFHCVPLPWIFMILSEQDVFS